MYKSLNLGLLGVKADGFEHALSLAKAHGFGAVGYSPADLTAQGLDGFAAQDLMGQYGVIISDFGLPVNITSKAAFDETFPSLEKTARMAASLGIRRCCTWMKSWSDELDYAENFAYHTKMLRTIASVLDAYGIRFGLEFLGPVKLLSNGKYPFIHTADKMLELCDAVGTGNIGLMLDAHHCYASGLSGGAFAQYIRAEKDIVLVHLNDDKPGVALEDISDSPRFYPGEAGGGANDLPAFMRALKDLGYTGPVVMEPFSEGLKVMPGPDEIAAAVSAGMDSVWQ
ncbi:MAG: sugar phosphate isomerase/epimerase [Oscillospiraceae bacterium]|nr:sugar phosphate isomerase/epimerase [Oscillospiraceae bacterium]